MGEVGLHYTYTHRLSHTPTHSAFRTTTFLLSGPRFFFLTAQVLLSLYCRYFFVLLSLGAVSLFVCFHIPEVLRNCLCLCCS